jgi:putative phage-type endonuclease
MEEQIKFLIENYGNDDQRTPAWFLKRSEMLTASEIWKCFGDASSSARKELIMSKLAPPKKGDGPSVGALIWGTRFEPIAKEIYCESEGVTLKDLACVQHPNVPYVGASPDGLILSNDERNGRLIELKCPISRIFDDSTPVPEHYFHQMQLQMECTNLQECDYVEMQFKTMNYSEWIETSGIKSCFGVHGNEVFYKLI